MRDKLDRSASIIELLILAVGTMTATGSGAVVLYERLTKVETRVEAMADRWKEVSEDAKEATRLLNRATQQIAVIEARQGDRKR